jgi:hypothetical protein
MLLAGRPKAALVVLPSALGLAIGMFCKFQSINFNAGITNRAFQLLMMRAYWRVEMCPLLLVCPLNK